MFPWIRGMPSGPKLSDVILLIGAGFRTVPSNFILFENRISIFHERAPNSNICFNTNRADTLDALQRWICGLFLSLQLHQRLTSRFRRWERMGMATPWLLPTADLRRSTSASAPDCRPLPSQSRQQAAIASAVLQGQAQPGAIEPLERAAIAQQDAMPLLQG